MRRVALLAAVLASAACGSSALQLEAPAPDGALDCALDRVTALGWEPAEGGTSGQFLTLVRSIDYTAGDAGREVAARALTLGLAGSNRLERERMTITRAGGVLRIQLTGVYENGEAGEPSGEGREHAEGVLTACGA